MEQKRIDEITARCEAATPGPWYSDGWGEWDDYREEFAPLHDTDPNAKFIAHARQDLPDLLTELSHSHKENEMLWRKVGELEAEVEGLRCAEQERKYYKFCNGNVLKTLEIAEAEMERLQRERDAAVDDIENLLRCAKDRDCGKYCAHDIKKDCENGWVCCGPEWRGPQEPTP